MDSLDEACEDKAVARTAWVKVREDETCNNEARENETGPAAGYPPGQGLDSDCVFNGLCQMACARCETCCVSDHRQSFSHWSNHSKKSLCQWTAFWGLSIQWFSSGKRSIREGTPSIWAALKAAMPCSTGTR